MLHHIGAAVYKRAVDDTITYDLPSWTPLVVLANIILLLPIWLFTQYSLQNLYPTFAIIEDENPPAYEPLTIGTDNEQGATGPKLTDGQPRTITSSLRSIYRLLRANGGKRANFRGLSIYIVQGILTNILVGIFSGTLGIFFTPVATLLATLALVQFSTAWVHIAITPRSNVHFWRRLPAFKRTFNAIWKPVTLFWLASEVARWLPALLAHAISLDLPTFQDGGESPNLPEKEHLAVFFSKTAAVWITTVICSVFIVIPAHVILTRVQASLISPDEDAVIPFDASFEGRIEPAIVGGRGYATMTDAWATYSKAAWFRLVFLYVKVTLVTIALNFIAALVFVVPSVILVLKNAEIHEGSN
jgi:hypothetical protein